ncbi:molecular chaperone DnaJ [Serratia marcescens]|uniref:Molecular chaperone n=1 Tax=Serratia phage Parlo TaxID=2557554 RepID=A0A482MI14_9CAUD|nr:molecular chaperone DnaJ [Serratia phage Parlo]PYA62688.1 molecular chaperone DnaJ [Serratia marcescens]PYA88102.1 molecular chaperone DnaJ [Serratia marcescens]QBQ72187.1 molecular chaperone [Serratia phage Parlo]
MAIPESTGLVKCPKCGGENGFHTKEVVDFKQFYDWSGRAEEGEHCRRIRGGGAFYCCDCGKNITAHVKGDA